VGSDTWNLDPSAVSLPEFYTRVDLLVQQDPKRVLGILSSHQRRSNRSVESRALLLWASGRANFELGNISDAVNLLTRSRRTAVDPMMQGRFSISLALALAESGRPKAAHIELDRAQELLDDRATGRIFAQRSLLYFHTGQFERALTFADQAVVRAVADKDQITMLRSIVNRSIIHLRRNELGAALADCERAASLANLLEQPLSSAAIAHNLALVQARSGRLLEALRTLDRASLMLGELGSPRRVVANLERDRAEMLLLVGLSEEASTAASTAEDLALQIGQLAAAAEAALLGAVALEVSGSGDGALRAAKRAMNYFRRSGRPGWVSYARFVSLRIELKHADSIGLTAAHRSRSRRIRKELENFGWSSEADQLLVFLAQRQVSSGEIVSARKILSSRRLSLVHDGLVGDRINAWLVEAQVRRAEGDLVGARRAVRSGMTLVERHANSVSTVLQPWAAHLGDDLTSLATSMALATGNASDVLVWADRWRAWTLARNRSSNSDPQLADALAELRRVSGMLGTDARIGAEIRRAEIEVSRRSRISVANLVRSTSLDVGALHTQLADRWLLEFVVDEENLWCVVVSPGHHRRLVRVAHIDTVRFEIDQLIGLVERAIRSSDDAVLDSYRHAARRLDELLLKPLKLNGFSDCVIVPTGPLHRVPWNVLPSFENRTISVTPSAVHWMRPTSTISSDRVGFVAGPGLSDAEREVQSLARQVDDSLIGASATVEACLALASRSRILHIAAHGRFREDHPFFSAVELYDGWLTIDDLAELERVPEVVVLSACDTGRVAVVGNEIVGFAYALFGCGVRLVIASLLAVPDRDMVSVMTVFHAGLRAGLKPEEALHQSIATVKGRAALSATLFVCIASDAR
jgi:tetratricopeptide (TPR) repeat protein